MDRTSGRQAGRVRGTEMKKIECARERSERLADVLQGRGANSARVSACPRSRRACSCEASPLKPPWTCRRKRDDALFVLAAVAVPARRQRCEPLADALPDVADLVIDDSPAAPRDDDREDDHELAMHGVREA